MDLQKLIYEVDGNVGVITLNCPSNFNAIDEQMASELITVLQQAERDNDIKVLVIKGREKAFSAGGAIGYFYDLTQKGEKISIDSLIEKVGIVTTTMKRMPKPIIASASGAIAGAGVSLALSADFVICSDTAKFILAFVNLGLVPDTGAAFLLTKQLGEKRAFELCATGRPFKAKEAYNWGLVSKVTTPDVLMDETMVLARKLAVGPLLAYKNIKKQIYEAAFKDYDMFLKQVEAPTQRECAESEDFIEGVKAFVEKRKPQFQGK